MKIKSARVKFWLQAVIAFLTAIATSVGVSSCVGTL